MEFKRADFWDKLSFKTLYYKKSTASDRNN